MLGRHSLFILIPLLTSAACAGYPGTRTPQGPATNSEASACGSAQLRLEDLQLRASGATVLVRTEQGMGSGFIVQQGDEQLVITNYHVVASGTQHAAEVTLPDGSQRRAVLEVVKVSRENDLALLKPKSELSPYRLPLRAETPVIGTNVAVLGYPGVAGSTPVLTLEPGTVTASTRQLGRTDFIQTNANINPGNSGGPLLDSCGRVLGVVTGRHLSAERLGLAIPSRAVTDLLAEYGKPQPAPEKLVEAQLQRFFTEVKFRRSDKAAEFFAREYVDVRAKEDLQQVAVRGQKKVDELDASLRKKGRELGKLPEAERSRLILGKLSSSEVFALGLVARFGKKELDAHDAALRWLQFGAAELFGALDDVWVESVEATKSGCMDAYATVSDAGQTRRYVVHLHHQNGEWLVNDVKQAR